VQRGVGADNPCSIADSNRQSRSTLSSEPPECCALQCSTRRLEHASHCQALRMRTGHQKQGNTESVLSACSSRPRVRVFGREKEEIIRSESQNPATSQRAKEDRRTYENTTKRGASMYSPGEVQYLSNLGHWNRAPGSPLAPHGHACIPKGTAPAKNVHNTHILYLYSTVLGKVAGDLFLQSTLRVIVEC
jgi:hypothetical protein